MQSHSKPRNQICPCCRGTHFHETQWKGFVERCVMYMWELRPYQCRDCYERFYLRPLANPEPDKSRWAPTPAPPPLREQRKTRAV
jgi:hypothetical protein